MVNYEVFLLLGALDHTYLINKLVRQKGQIINVRLYFSPLRR
jgi:hypothetical protein